MENILLMKNDKVFCKFCNKPCAKGTRERKRYWWWECEPCKVNFLVSLKGNLDVIEFESKEENDRFYSLHILVNKKRTDICVWNKETPTLTFTYKPGAKNIESLGTWNQKPNKSYYTQDLVTSFNQVLDITPANLESKLKTYLLLL